MYYDIDLSNLVNSAVVVNIFFLTPEFKQSIFKSNLEFSKEKIPLELHVILDEEI